MSQVPIQKLRAGDGSSPLDEISWTFDAIRRRAYELFQERGAAAGRELENWLDAERELAWIPPAEMTENETAFAIRVAAPGFDTADLAITATPEALLIEGAKKDRTEKGDRLIFSEYAERSLFRRFTFTKAIDIEKVTATLTKGELLITAPKGDVQAGKEKKIAIAA